MRRPALMLIVLCAGCGARSALAIEPCGDAGVRACETECGIGEQACVAGRWQACVVPVAERSCEATCGTGAQRCIDGEWSECVGPPSGRRACNDACGSGEQECRDGAWLQCEVPIAERPCRTECGEGIETCAGGRWGPCSADRPMPPVLRVVVRDFHASHPDFESAIGSDRGIVDRLLGPDDKPVYRGPTPTTHGRELFDQWYRDVPGVNLPASMDLVLVPSPADPTLFVYDDPTFFPIDGELFGDEGNEHNFHFTLEARAEFVYQGGEIFRFRGDDDVFVFINRVLAIDLGGVHGTEEQTVELDRIADTFGIAPGGRYAIHLFFAERHTDMSTFTVETTVADRFRCE